MGLTIVTVQDATTDARARQIRITAGADRRLQALMSGFQGTSQRAVASTILQHYCSREAYIAALAGQPDERHEPMRVRQIRITPGAHHYLRKLAAELGATPRAVASAILERYCSREAYVAALTRSVHGDDEPAGE